jgi:HPr kinase/phosphorylase
MNMRVHASCVAWPGPAGNDAILLKGPPGAGKSEFVLRLMQRGFKLVADDQVCIEDGIARVPAALAGLLEVRGLGIFHLPYLAAARLRLVVRLDVQPVRLPEPEIDAELGLPVVTIDPAGAAAPERAALALEAACGRVAQIAGAFAA